MSSHRKFANFVPPTKIAYVDGRPKTIQLRKCRLTVQQESAPPLVREFDQPVVTIGAMDDNDLTISEETVSRYHCKIFQEDSAYLVRDLGSTNGTSVNGVRLREAWLNPDCEIYLGNCRVTFHAYDEEVEIKASPEERCGDIIGRNLRMRELFGMIEKIAPTGATVVIEGETGTGKEVVARTLHRLSTRKNKPFIVFDCGAVPESLIESELFGHEKGSFTGAIMTRQGLFEMAQGGTIFLDELGELSIDLQPKLLRVLEQREVRRVGSNKPIPIDVRVIAATNRRLEAEVREGRFREDLFYRLSVVRVFLPPLRERKEDISLLVHHFLREHRYNRGPDDQLRVRHLTPGALRALESHAWPGNIRELVNVVERACSFTEGDTLDIHDLPDNIIQSAGLRLPLAAQLASPDDPNAITSPHHVVDPNLLQDKTFKEAKEEWISAFERDYIVALLERNQHNISHAAREAEIDRKYFRKLMKKYDIEGHGG
jgi:transcriptional regulator with GAF, ATPase, and Fis domain